MSQKSWRRWKIRSVHLQGRIRIEGLQPFWPEVEIFPRHLVVRGRVLKTHEEESWPRLRKEAPSIEHHRVDRVAQRVEASNGGTEVVAAMRRSQARDVFQNNDRRDAFIHSAKYVEPTPKRARFASS